MTTQELIARAEKIERQPDGSVYVTLSVGSLTAEEFAELIMGEVKKLQSENVNHKFVL